MIFVTVKTTIARKCSKDIEALAGIGKLVRMPTPFLLRVALPVPLPRLFDYLPPGGHAPSATDIGRRVKVPFGSRELTGIVAEVGAVADSTPELRQVTAFLDTAPLSDSATGPSFVPIISTWRLACAAWAIAASARDSGKLSRPCSKSGACCW